MSDRSAQRLDELHLNGVGKLFFAAVAAWIAGKAVSLKIRASQREAAALAQAVVASKRFRDEIAKPGATVTDVMNLMSAKAKTAADFEAAFGTRWPL